MGKFPFQNDILLFKLFSWIRKGTKNTTFSNDRPSKDIRIHFSTCSEVSEAIFSECLNVYLCTCSISNKSYLTYETRVQNKGQKVNKNQILLPITLYRSLSDLTALDVHIGGLEVFLFFFLVFFYFFQFLDIFFL